MNCSPGHFIPIQVPECNHKKVQAHGTATSIFPGARKDSIKLVEYLHNGILHNNLRSCATNIPSQTSLLTAW